MAISLETKDGELIPLPKAVGGVRVAQCIFAVVVLGLTAHLESQTAYGTYWEEHATLAAAIFAIICSLTEFSIEFPFKDSARLPAYIFFDLVDTSLWLLSVPCLTKLMATFKIPYVQTGCDAFGCVDSNDKYLGILLADVVCAAVSA